jgi:hypothetical protein
MGFTEWTPIWGGWDLRNKDAIFHAGSSESGVGLILGPDRMTDGEVRFTTRASVQADSSDPSSLGSDIQTRLLFGYDPGGEGGYLAGIGGFAGRFVVQRFGIKLSADASRDAWRVVAFAGDPSPQPLDQNLNLGVRTGGTRASLSASGTAVIDTNLPTPMTGDQVGLFVQGQNTDIHISNFRMVTARPQLFNTTRKDLRLRPRQARRFVNL